MKHLTMILLNIMAIYAIWFTLDFHLNVPVVAFSHSSGECVYIIEEGVKKPCDVIPARYILEHVK